MLKSKSQEVIYRHLAGHTNISIARSLGITKERVSQIISSKKGKDEINRLAQNIKENYIDKQSDKVLKDPAQEILNDLKLRSVNFLDNLLSEDRLNQISTNYTGNRTENTMINNVFRLLEYAGYTAKNNKTQSITDEEGNTTIYNNPIILRNDQINVLVSALNEVK